VLLFGKEVGGNRSWLAVGPVTFQPAEFAKWTTCLAVAAFLSKRVHDRLRFVQGVQLGAIIGVPMLLILKQPDFGTALTFVPIGLAAVLLGGLRWRVVAVAMIAVALLAPVGWRHLKPYQKERILTVVDPDRDPSGVGYQVRQSKIAVGSGQLTGKGLFKGTQTRLNFLPAQHTDFVLAVIAEELGFIGAAGVLALFYYLLYRGLLAARSSQDRLGTYLSLLVVAWLTGQAAINIGMVLGLMPTIGVPLPLLSYGGTALIAVTCAVGLIANVRGRRFVN
jgi:rod shape determining protein RodA